MTTPLHKIGRASRGLGPGARGVPSAGRRLLGHGPLGPGRGVLRGALRRGRRRPEPPRRALVPARASARPDTGGFDGEDPSRTRQSPLTLATFRSWGGSQDDAARGAGDECTRRRGLPARRGAHEGPGKRVTDATADDWPRCAAVRYIPCPLRAVGTLPPVARNTRRIRLVAYGARLESVLGASPRGFESPILRHVDERCGLGGARALGSSWAESAAVESSTLSPRREDLRTLSRSSESCVWDQRPPRPRFPMPGQREIVA